MRRQLIIIVVLLTTRGLSSPVHAKTDDFDSHTWYTHTVHQIDSLLVLPELPSRQAYRLLDSLSSHTEGDFRDITSERWQQLLTREELRIRLALHQNCGVKERLAWLDSVDSREESASYLNFFAQTLQQNNDCKGALTLAMKSLFISRSSMAETIANDCYLKLNHTESTFPEYRDNQLRRYALLYFEEQKKITGKMDAVNRFLRNRLFEDTEEQTFGIVAFWDEYITEDETEYLREVFQTASALGLEFVLCYAGRNESIGMLHLPPDLPVTGISFKQEIKSSKQIHIARLPGILLTNNSGQVLLFQVGVNRSLAAMLPDFIANLRNEKE